MFWLNMFFKKKSFWISFFCEFCVILKNNMGLKLICYRSIGNNIGLKHICYVSNVNKILKKFT